MCFDSMIFGNGMTLNLLNQLRPFVPKEYHFILSFDGYMEAFIKETLPSTMEKAIFNALFRHNNVTNQDFYSNIKQIIRKYYCVCDGNIEKHFGLAEFQKEMPFDYGAIKNLMPFFYNMWFCHLNKVLMETKQRKRIKRFYTSVKEVLSENAVCYTTNFDLFSDRILLPKHLHGRFHNDLRKYDDCKWEREGEEFTLRYLWGWNGLGKGIAIYERKDREGATQLFDWDFFLEDQPISNLLIYGLSFQRSGFITDDFISQMPQYKEPAPGMVIDEHILIRLKGLQNKDNGLRITFAYYSKADLIQYRGLAKLYGLNNVSYIPTSSFDFHI